MWRYANCVRVDLGGTGSVAASLRGESKILSIFARLIDDFAIEATTVGCALVLRSSETRRLLQDMLVGIPHCLSQVSCER